MATKTLKSKHTTGRRSLDRLVRVRSWHALKKSEQEEILRSKITVGTFMERFRQPKWCNYPEALAGMMGCWSLMTPGSIRNFDSCKGCECRAPKARAHSNARTQVRREP